MGNVYGIGYQWKMYLVFELFCWYPLLKWLITVNSTSVWPYPVGDWFNLNNWLLPWLICNELICNGYKCMESPEIFLTSYLVHKMSQLLIKKKKSFKEFYMLHFFINKISLRSWQKGNPCLPAWYLVWAVIEKYVNQKMFYIYWEKTFKCLALESKIKIFIYYRNTNSKNHIWKYIFQSWTLFLDYLQLHEFPLSIDFFWSWYELGATI